MTIGSQISWTLTCKNCVAESIIMLWDLLTQYKNWVKSWYNECGKRADILLLFTWGILCSVTFIELVISLHFFLKFTCFSTLGCNCKYMNYHCFGVFGLLIWKWWVVHMFLGRKSSGIVENAVVWMIDCSGNDSLFFIRLKTVSNFSPRQSLFHQPEFFFCSVCVQQKNEFTCWNKTKIASCFPFISSQFPLNLNRTIIIKQKKLKNGWLKIKISIAYSSLLLFRPLLVHYVTISWPGLFLFFWWQIWTWYACLFWMLLWWRGKGEERISCNSQTMENLACTSCMLRSRYLVHEIELSTADLAVF